MFAALARSRRIAMLLPLTLCAAPAAAQDMPPVVTVHAGKLSGVHKPAIGLDEFKGIPYAAPPVGALRWKPPQPVAAWQGVRKADHFAPRCMQLSLFGDMAFRSDGMSEDCLYLNVWTPTHRAGTKLPVLVYFYGGGFLAGDGSEWRYDGASLARKGIVTVTVNYRLGVFGFLALPALAAESPHHATGNYGLLDQVAALRWVQRNIAAFGGDPDEVTIGGESAGSMSVSALVASPLSKGLMARAIGESGAMLDNLAPQPLAMAERHGQAFAKLIGAHSLAKLRAQSAASLLADVGRMRKHSDAPPFGPTIDGYFLPRSPAAIYLAGRQAHVPLLVGSNSQEASWQSLLRGKTLTPANYRALITQQFGRHADAALTLFPGRSTAEVKASATHLASAEFTAISTWSWMRLQRKTGHAPVYYYYFTQPRPATRDGSAEPGVGAVHSGEIEYALGNLDSNHVYAWTSTDHHVSRIMEGYFANFIKTGNPNGDGLPHWPQATLERGGLLRQVIGADTRTIVDRNIVPRYEFLLRHSRVAWVF